MGLSEITKLAPAVLISTLMAIWFLATSAAQFIAGHDRQAGRRPSTVGGQVLDPRPALATSLNVFRDIGWVGVGFGVRAC